jgi:hypothetical protein
MKASKIILIAAAMLFACAHSTTARTVLQAQMPAQPMPAAGQPLPPAGEVPPPPQCENRFEPERIDCAFTCPVTGGWRLRCETSVPNVVSCHVRRDQGTDQESTYFLCLTVPQQAPNCQPGVNLLNNIPDPCVSQNVNQITMAWQAVPKQG